MSHLKYLTLLTKISHPPHPPIITVYNFELVFKFLQNQVFPLQYLNPQDAVKITVFTVLQYHNPRTHAQTLPIIQNQKQQQQNIADSNQTFQFSLLITPNKFYTCPPNPKLPIFTIELK
ncbi:hypothetical protein ABPG72_017572 [Tetrahymena utriculariae]